MMHTVYLDIWGVPLCVQMHAKAFYESRFAPRHLHAAFKHVRDCVHHDSHDVPVYPQGVCVCVSLCVYVCVFLCTLGAETEENRLH